MLFRRRRPEVREIEYQEHNYSRKGLLVRIGLIILVIVVIIVL